MTKPHKILWGVCGIGNGHTFRQLPLIEHFAKDCNIVVFGYGESYDFYAKRFTDHPRVSVERVAVPFFVGNATGLDFAATAAHPNNTENYAAINAAAMARAEQRIGKPDLVVSDYEPISAQYAYAYNAPLVTVDQQSKYLTGAFPAPLNGQTYADEIMRLRLFFPRAEKRLAASFFKVARKPDAVEDVEYCPPVLNDRITALRRTPDIAGKTILMYLSSQQPFGQSFEEISAVCASRPDTTFHLFGKNIPQLDAPNVRVYKNGDPRFHDVLACCNGIICTAGHTLLSEAMYLGIPVYGIPLPLYEQEMNAWVIDRGGFGISRPAFNAPDLAQFMDRLPRYAAAIQADRAILLRSPGQDVIVRHLQQQMRPG